MTDNDTATAATVDASAIAGPLTEDQAAQAFAARLDEEEAPQADTPKLREKPEPTPDDEPEAEAQPEDAEADDDPDGDEDTAQEDASDDEAQDDKAEAEPISDPKARITLPNGDTVTVEELYKGNLRQADYTRKNQHRVELENQVKQSWQTAKNFAESVQRESNALAGIMVEALNTLDQIDPVAANQLRSKAYELDNQIKSEQQQRAQSAQHVNTEATKRQAADNLSTMQALTPELFSRDGWTSFQNNASQAMQDVGYTQKEVNELLQGAANGQVDPRMVALLSLASRQKALMAEKPKVKAKTQNAKPMKASKRRSNQSAAQQRYSEKLARVRKTGRDEDAAAAFLEIID